MNASGTAGPIFENSTGTAARKSSRSAQNLVAKQRPSEPAGNSVGDGKERSSSRAIAWLSQNTSAPRCSTGILRYPPVSGTRWGLGMICGWITERHASPL